MPVFAYESMCVEYEILCILMLSCVCLKTKNQYACVGLVKRIAFQYLVLQIVVADWKKKTISD